MNYAGSVRRNLAQFLPRGLGGRTALALLPLLLAFGALLLLTAGPAGAQATDYDTDDDTLIEIDSEAKLIAIAYDLNGDGTAATGSESDYGAGFPNVLSTQCDDAGTVGTTETCTGYELTQDITLTANWTPTGSYAATFDGNGYRINGLTISATSGHAGLFGEVGATGIIRDVGIISPSISSSAANNDTGALAGQTANGSRISASYVSGGTVSTTGTNASTGGLVGYAYGSIRASYSTAAVSGDDSGAINGGLVGLLNSDTVIASYAASTVSSTGGGTLGGLIGRVFALTAGSAAVTNSYCDTTVRSGSCIGSRNSQATTDGIAASGYATTALQTPTSYAGIYAFWNIDLDASSSLDFPWNFGTSSQYPTLRTPTQRATSPTDQAVGDYDWDDDTLIEIRNPAQLAAITHDLDGDGLRGTVVQATWDNYTAAFPSAQSASQCDDGATGGTTETCTGYELGGDLTLSGAWTPIGGNYAATLDGNGYAISGMSISHSATSSAGLISRLAATGVIRNLGVINATVAVTSTNANGHGILVGFIADGGVVSASYVSGGSLTVATTGTRAGPLVGHSRGTITASYATATVAFSGNPASGNLGGLVGHLEGGSITASYATGAITEGSGATVYHGGLVGRSSDISTNTPSITNSYCSAASGETACIGYQVGSTVTVAASLETASALQTPTDYTGLYLRWLLDLDSDNVPDYLWDFGTSSDYPTLNTLAERAALTPPPTDYDTDDDRLIEISTLAQLNAVRWDLNADGDPDATEALRYSVAFGGRTHTATTTEGRMGCPLANGCNGYELAADLDFDSDGSGTVDSSDAFGGNFVPLGTYTATFNGNGYILSNLTIDTSSQRTGLFSELSSGGRIRYLGLVNPDISGGGANAAEVGGMVGRNNGIVSASFISGGTVNAKGDTTIFSPRLGGLTGVTFLNGQVVASYATASVTTGTANAFVGGLVGSLDGDGNTGTATIRASYAAPPSLTHGGNNERVGGLIGRARRPAIVVADSYCDTTTRSGGCIGQTFSTTVSAAGHPTTDLQTPTAYDGLYANWDVDVDGVSGNDLPWDFGSSSHYPLLKADKNGDGTATCAEFSGQTCYIPPPPPTPTSVPPPPGQAVARGGGQPYHPASAHPEIYTNPRHEMTASCALKTTGEGDDAQTTSTLTFDLGTYTRPITLVLSLWDGQFFRTLQSQGLPTPQLQQDGQTATVEVVTDPTQTRFRIDSQYGLNLVLGYADCRTDDP